MLHVEINTKTIQHGEEIIATFIAEKGLPTSERELQRFTEFVSQQLFNRPFQHRISYNARLKTTGGRYHLETGHIDLNPNMLYELDTTDFMGILKHELCHYHLHQTGRGFYHRDDEFKALLKAVGGLRYVRWSKDKFKAKYEYKCQRCQQPYYRMRKLNTKKFVCGNCRGQLVRI